MARTKFGPSHGEAHCNAKLSNEQVIEIYLARGKEKIEYLASKYNVSTSTISQIHTGKGWGHITQHLRTRRY